MGQRRVSYVEARLVALALADEEGESRVQGLDFVEVVQDEGPVRRHAVKHT